MNDSVINVIAFYDELIEEYLDTMRKVYVAVANTESSDKQTLSECNMLIGELENKLEKCLAIRKIATEQIVKGE